jgi:hypothetical protein
MYLANPQARVGGLHTLSLDCLSELRCKGLTGTSAFKTAAVYGSQMIITCPATLRLIEYWVRFFRTSICTDDSGDFLFLASNGKPHSHLGSCVTAFFRPHGLHITTTTLRYVSKSPVLSNILILCVYLHPTDLCNRLRAAMQSVGASSRNSKMRQSRSTKGTPPLLRDCITRRM